MKTVQLGHTDQRVSQLALGCMLMGTKTDETTSCHMLDRYLDVGGTFLDTADCYSWWLRRYSAGGESEELIGRWLARRGRRDDVFLATKGGGLVHDPASLWGEGDEPDWDRRKFVGAGADTIHAAIDASLRRLGTDHVDLYYVHVDDRSTPLEETLGALAEIVQGGKARYIGWSNVRTWRLERIRQLCLTNGWPTPIAVQQQHSYLRRRAGLVNASIVGDEQWDYLAEHDDLTLVAYSPILGGVYDDPARNRMMGSYAGPDAEARLAAVSEVAAEIGAAPTQVVLAWLQHLTSPKVIPLVGPRTPEQLESALLSVDITLTPERLQRLDSAGA